MQWGQEEPDMRPCGIALLLLVAFAAGVWLSPAAALRAQNQAPPARWQYGVFYQADVQTLGGKTLHDNLNKLGEAGWELVQVVPGLSDGHEHNTVKQTVYFFKRLKER
jgi:hypothetical protein